ncbi:MAG: LysE family translocator [Pseudomonadota bacterium]
MDMNLVIAMLGIHALMFLSPGPDSVIIVSRALAQGLRHAFAAILGVVAAGIVFVPAVAFALEWVSTLSPATWMAVRALGALYLVYLGTSLLRGMKADEPRAPEPLAESYRAAFLQGLLTNLGNPKMFLLLTSFLPQFVAPELGYISMQILILGLLMYLNGLVCFSLLALTSVAIKRLLVRGRKAQNLSRFGHGFAGATMVSLGAWMLFAPVRFLLVPNR